MKKLTFLFIPILFFACEKEIPLNAEQADPKIVINAIFVANDTLWVNLSESSSVLTQNYTSPAILGANLTLNSQSGGMLGTFTETFEGNYFLASPTPVAGETYILNVSKNGFINVSAQSYTPEIVNVTSIDTLTLSNGDFEFTVKINDVPNENNSYGIALFEHTVYIDEFSLDTFYYVSNFFSTREEFIDNGYGDPGSESYAGEFYFSDKTFNGNTINFKGKTEKNIWAEIKYYEIVVRSMSEDLYRYKISLEKYYQSQGNPFAEPVQVYSNVENGLGIFGGYSEYRDTIWLE